MPSLGALAAIMLSGCGARIPLPDGARRLGELVEPSACRVAVNAPGLSYHHRPLSCIARASGFLTTPFKYLGIFGWTEIAPDATVRGRVYQPPAWSTDGLTTIDVEIESLQVNVRGWPACTYVPSAASSTRWIRIEVKPWVVAPWRVNVEDGQTIEAKGRLVLDTDPPGFYEIHPATESDLIVAPAR